MMPLRIRVPPKSNEWRSYKERDTQKHTHMGKSAIWARGRDEPYAVISQRIPRLAGSHEMLGERHRTNLSSVTRRSQLPISSPPPPAWFWVSGLLNCKSLSVVLSHLICVTFSWQPQETSTDLFLQHQETYEMLFAFSLTSVQWSFLEAVQCLISWQTECRAGVWIQSCSIRPDIKGFMKI